MKQAIAAPTVLEFSSTRAAYNATQTGDIPNGTILVVPSEGVVGLATTWPFAVTADIGCLHGTRADITISELESSAKLPAGCVIAAIREAARRGYPVAPHFVAGATPQDGAACVLANDPMSDLIGVYATEIEEARTLRAAHGKAKWVIADAARGFDPVVERHGGYALVGGPAAVFDSAGAAHRVRIRSEADMTIRVDLRAMPVDYWAGKRLEVLRDMVDMLYRLPVAQA